MALEPIRWLHLSDLHVGCRGETAWWQTHDVFRRQLGEWVERVGPPDLVLFTGDLTNRAKTEEFVALDAFLEELYTTLEQAGAKTRPLLLPVPGNHDLVRPSGAAMRQFAWIKEVLATPAKFDEFVDARPPGEIAATFQRYQEWFQRSVLPSLSAHKIHCSAFPGNYSTRIELADRPPLVVVGLNSAWAHYQNVKEGALALPVGQFQKALPRDSAASPLDLFRDDPLALLLMHHPPTWLSPAQRAEFLRDVAEPGRFAACLFGHMHDARSENTSTDAGAKRVWYQSPSLFGAKHYGESQERPLSGFTLGELHENGEVRIWPLRLVEQGGGQAFDWDSHFSRTKSKGAEFVRLREGRKARGKRGKGRGPQAPRPGEAGLRDYLNRALAEHGKLEMMGLDVGEYPLTLEQIYVPLRASGRMELPAEHGRALRKMEAARLDAGMQEIELLQLFAHATTARPHIVLLGEPGAGKSTALRKLLSVCCDGTDALAGLAPGVVPVLLPLRQVKAEDLPADNAATKKGAASALSDLLLRYLGAADHAAVWPQRQVLLLLDGLDEVPDALRPRVARWLRNELPRHRHLRVVVTSRVGSYTEDVELGETFTTFEVRPLQSAQIVEFVRLWFQAVQPAVRKLDAEAAGKAADRLIETLLAEQYSNQQLMSLVGSPLLLTLLCIVVLRGGVMPKQRVQFYESCLRILLQTWRKVRLGSEPLLPPELAIEVLAPVAYRMHKDNQQELERASLADRIDEQVLPRRRDVTGYDVLSWLHEGAGLLRKLVGDTFKFSHLGFQEYLAALHLAQHAATERAHLVAHAGEEWWLEVALLFVAMPGQATFGPFVRDLLATKDPVQHEDLIRAALETASQPDIGPLLDALEAEKKPVRQAFLLRLMHGRLDPRLGELARRLCTSKDKDVQARAAQILEHEQRQRGQQDVLVLHAAGAVDAVLSLRAALASRGLGMRSFALESRDALADELSTLLKCVHDLVIVTRPADKAAWADAQLRPLVAPLARRVQRCIQLRPGSSKADLLPAGIRAIAHQFEEPDALAQWLAAERAPAVVSVSGVGALDDAPPERFGIRFLAVPADVFSMGFKGQPEADAIHRVEMSVFWLAETSITNAQYRLFLEATKAAPPMNWGDRRFGADEQPVVGVSWHEAKAFCVWLGTVLQRRVALPSEAQREYAARGHDDRPFPGPGGT